MAVHTIPARTIVVCDVCNRECCNGGATRLMQGKLTIARVALDMLNMPAADGTVSYDLCDTCLIKLETGINTIAKGIRKDTKS